MNSKHFKHFKIFNYSIFVLFKLSFKIQKIKYIQLGELWSWYEDKNLVTRSGCSDDYDWDSLYKSIEKYGQKKPIVLKLRSNTYHVVHGFHRVKVMKQLYPPDKKVSYVDDSDWLDGRHHN